MNTSRMIPPTFFTVLLLLFGLASTAEAAVNAEALKKAAGLLNEDAQYHLAYLYRTGNHPDIPKDLKKAAHWYLQAANQGHVEAQYNLGVCYEWGDGVEKNLKEALEWYEWAAKKGHPSALYAIGSRQLTGNGIKQDVPKAIELLKKATKPLDYKSAGQSRTINADPAAFWLLGQTFYEGKLIKQDFDEAAKWLLLSAESGEAVAQYLMGQMHAKGNGVRKSAEMALAWYSVAEQDEGNYKGNINARKQEYLKELGFDKRDESWVQNRVVMFVTVLTGEIRREYNLVKQAFEAGDMSAAETAKRRKALYNKIEVPQKIRELVAQYIDRINAEKGDALAQLRLGQHYWRQKDGRKEALKWLHKAASQGIRDAFLWIGLAHHSGNGATQDYKQAADWFLMGAMRGDVDCAFMLGEMHLNGHGFPRDKFEALKWYEFAAPRYDNIISNPSYSINGYFHDYTAVNPNVENDTRRFLFNYNKLRGKIEILRETGRFTKKQLDAAAVFGARFGGAYQAARSYLPVSGRLERPRHLRNLDKLIAAAGKRCESLKYIFAVTPRHTPTQILLEYSGDDWEAGPAEKSDVHKPGKGSSGELTGQQKASAQKLALYYSHLNRGKNPQVSPNGKWIAGAIAIFPNTICVSNASDGFTTLPQRLLHSAKHKNSLPLDIVKLLWSPNEKRLAVVLQEELFGNDKRSYWSHLRVWSYDKQWTANDYFSLDHGDDGTETGQISGSLSWSSDGKYLAGSDGKHAIIWEAASGKELWKFKESVRRIAWSPDGKQIAAGGYGLEVKVRDALSGKVTHSLKHWKDGIYAIDDRIEKLIWSPSGKSLAAIVGRSSAGSEGDIAKYGTASLSIWDANTGERTHALDEVNDMCWNPSGSIFITGARYRLGMAIRPNTIKAWDSKTGGLLGTIKKGTLSSPLVWGDNEGSINVTKYTQYRGQDVVESIKVVLPLDKFTQVRQAYQTKARVNAEQNGKLSKLPDGDAPGEFKFKGIHLGMNIYKAAEILNNKFKGLNLKVESEPKNAKQIGAYEKDDWGFAGIKVWTDEGATRADVSNKGVWLYAGPNMQIQKITLTRLACNLAFGIDNASSNTRFAQEFAKGYNLGRMNSFSRTRTLTGREVGLGAPFGDLPSDLKQRKSGCELVDAKAGYSIEIITDILVWDTGGAKGSDTSAKLMTDKFKSGTQDILIIKPIKKSKFD